MDPARAPTTTSAAGSDDAAAGGTGRSTESARPGEGAPPGPVHSSPPSTAPAAPLPTTPCGAGIAKADGSPWECTFVDHFDGVALDRTKWVPQVTPWTGYHSGLECFHDSPENVQVRNGELSLVVRDEGFEFWCGTESGGYRTRYTSGMVSTYGRFAQRYGRVEIRARVQGATAPGLHSALWLWPDDESTGGSSELDIAELFSLYPDRAVPYLHYPGSDLDPLRTNTSCFIADVSRFHTYTVEWSADHVEIIYDGRTCLRNEWNDATRPRQNFDQPFILILTQALGIGTNTFIPGLTPLPAATIVDHVKVWQ